MDEIILTDQSTGVAYKLTAVDGKLYLSETSGAPTETVHLIDAVTGQHYDLVLNTGKLFLMEVV